MDYLRFCLWYSAASDIKDVSAKNVSKLNSFVRLNYEPNEDNFIHKYLLLVKQIILAKRGNIELTCLYDLLNTELEILTQQCIDLTDVLVSSLKEVSETTRILVAKSVGILWSIGSSLDKFNSYVISLL